MVQEPKVRPDITFPIAYIADAMARLSQVDGREHMDALLELAAHDLRAAAKKCDEIARELKKGKG